jgi:tRNA1(Val) A37 N6-methylase TrmN6
MANPTEETINPLVAEYLRDHGFNITAETTAKNKDGNTRQVDFELREGRKFYGEGEWNKTYQKGWSQAIEYGDLPGASGYFLIGYDDNLGDSIKQKRLQTMDPGELLSGHEFQALFKIHGEGSPSMFQGPIKALPGWMEDSLEDGAGIDPEAFIDLMRDLVDDLTDYIPDSSNHPSLFRNIFPDLEGGNQGARDASAYVLLNQIVFYRILESYGYQTIDRNELKHPADLTNEYFGQIKGGAYDAVFNVDVASLVKQDGLDHLKDIIKYVDELSPEEFSSDLLGNTFHSLIPFDVRKSVAAYYTNPAAARLLANISIQDADAKVADFACGSGTLLLSSYERKKDLLFGDINADVHETFVDKHITGVDIMPFAAHLATVQLALRNPGYETHATRIAIEDSTKLEPGDIISPQQKSLADGKLTNLSEWSSDGHVSGNVEAGAAATEFEIGEVNTVIMNPPFTRKQKFDSYYRGELRKRLSDYIDYIDDEMGFYGYFFPLADKFLEDDGRIAMVIPAVLLQQTSLEGIRRMLQSKYTLEHLVLTQYRSAFSEDTSYRDILLVARKDPDGDDPCRISSLSVLPTDGSVPDLTEGLMMDIDGEFENDLLHTVELPQSEFRESLDWMTIVRQHLDFEFFYDYPDESRFDGFSEQIDSMIGGLRLENSSDYIHPDNSLISHPREANVHINWEITDEEAVSYAAQSVDRGNTVKVPKNVLRPALRSFSGMRTMEIENPPDHVVMEEFPGDSNFWWSDDPDLDRRQRHVESRMGNLVLGGYGNLDLTAPGTSFLATTYEDGIAPTWSLWSVSVASWEDAKLLALWWNSTYSVAKLITERNEVRGGVVKWRKGDLLDMPVPDLDDLSDEEREELLEVYDEVAGREFPALVHQFENTFDARRKIDEKWNEVLDWGYDDESLDALYEQIASFLTDMKEMMDQD